MNELMIVFVLVLFPILFIIYWIMFGTAMSEVSELKESLQSQIYTNSNRISSLVDMFVKLNCSLMELETKVEQNEYKRYDSRRLITSDIDKLYDEIDTLLDELNKLKAKNVKKKKPF